MKRIKTLFVMFIICLCSAFAACENPTKFDLDFMVDDEVYATITTAGNATLEMPEDPEKEGYTFEGWYWDKDVWEEPFKKDSLTETSLTEDVEVYAKWSANKYCLSLNVNNGVSLSDIIKEVTFDDSYTLPITTRDDYIFIGWFITKDETEVQLTDNNGNSLSEWNIADDVQVYAKWQKIIPTELIVELVNQSYVLQDNTITTTYTGEKFSLTAEDFKIKTAKNDGSIIELSQKTEFSDGYVFESTIPNEKSTPAGEYKFIFKYDNLDNTEITVKVNKATIDETKLYFIYDSDAENIPSSVFNETDKRVSFVNKTGVELNLTWNGINPNNNSEISVGVYSYQVAVSIPESIKNNYNPLTKNTYLLDYEIKENDAPNYQLNNILFEYGEGEELESKKIVDNANIKYEGGFELYDEVDDNISHITYLEPSLLSNSSIFVFDRIELGGMVGEFFVVYDENNPTSPIVFENHSASNISLSVKNESATLKVECYFDEEKTTLYKSMLFIIIFANNPTTLNLDKSSVYVAAGGTCSGYQSFMNSTQSRGSGFIYSIDSENKFVYIVTANYVISGYEDRIYILLPTQEICRATLVGYTSHYNIAVLKISVQSLEGLTPISVYNSTNLTTNERVFTNKNIYSKNIYQTATISNINALVRIDMNNFYSREIEVSNIEYDYLGGGGSALFNVKGQFIGMVNEYNHTNKKLYAIPGNLVTSIVASIINNNGNATYVNLGAELVQDDSEPERVEIEDNKFINDYKVIVSSVQVGSISHEKFVSGDEIISFTYTDIFEEEYTIVMFNQYSYEDIMFVIKPGSTITFNVKRGGDSIQVSIQATSTSTLT